MKESEIVGKNEEYPEHYEVLSGLSLLISRSGKNRKTEGLQGKKVKRKRPHVTRNWVLHKVVDFLFFLGFSQDITFYPFEDMWGYPEIILSFPLA